MAALKALGYDNTRIGLHYLKLVLLIVALGVVMGQLFVDMYADSFRFPDMRFRLRPDLVLIAIGVALTAAVLATFNAIRATVLLAPAEAMRAPPPKAGCYSPTAWPTSCTCKWVTRCAWSCRRAGAKCWV